MKEKRWFAKGGGIARSGPYPTDVRAAEVFTLHNGNKPVDFAIWPEMVEVLDAPIHKVVLRKGADK